jgi:hypothetical protein
VSTLADATAALDKVLSSVRDLPKLQLPVGGHEKLPEPQSSSGWVAAASSPGKQKKSDAGGGCGFVTRGRLSMSTRIILTALAFASALVLAPTPGHALRSTFPIPALPRCGILPFLLVDEAVVVNAF